MIRWVTFDADDTLLDLQTSMWDALIRVLGDLKTTTPATAALTASDLYEQWLITREQVVASWAEIRRAAFAASLASVGVDDPGFVDDVVRRYFAYRRLTNRPFPDVLPALQRLGANYRLGYATNGNSQAPECGLAGVFAFEVYAYIDDLPPKPSPLFFARVVRETGARPEEVVYVGDHWEHDIVAARRAGLRAVWLNRTGADAGSGAGVGSGAAAGSGADAVITSLADLPDVLASWDA